MGLEIRHCAQKPVSMNGFIGEDCIKTAALEIQGDDLWRKIKLTAA
jgi:hypothetical protein